MTNLTAMQRDAIKIAIESLERSMLILAGSLDTGRDPNGYPIASVASVSLELDDKTSALVVLHGLVGTTPKEI